MRTIQYRFYLRTPASKTSMNNIVHAFDLPFAQPSAGNNRLICNDDHGIAQPIQCTDRSCNTRQDPELFHAPKDVNFSVDRPVAIQKYRLPFSLHVLRDGQNNP